MTLRRFGLALVVAAFCLPLFVGLGKADLENDEAIYSFSVDRILESGDWLVPKSSPEENAAFLEKPPLKFWIVAAPIRLGLLPLNEFSLRFWDALFGGFAFLYVFWIGSVLAGPVCGAVSVLMLFTFGPLLFDHGLRGNNMEAALLLSYCGGVYHYLRWAKLDDDRRGWRHALAVGLYFVLGFMTKFVAVLFLPLVLGVGSALTKDYRHKLVRDWRIWSAVGGLSLALCVPWFAYATWRFGTLFWHTILGQHVYERFTTYLNPAHVQPWSFYWSSLYQGYAGSDVLVLVGALLLLAQAIRQRWPEGAIVVLWFWLPVTLISMGTSKLVHYAYPFVPPIALSVGYLVAYVLRVAPAPLDRILWGSDEYATRRIPRAIAALRRPTVRVALLAIAALATGVAVASVIYGPIRLGVGSSVFFKNSGVFRPAIVAAVCAVLAGESRRATRAIVPLLVAGLLPLPAYRQTLGHLADGEHPMRSARDCLVRVESQVGGAASPGMYVDVRPPMWHPVNYYFRRVRPWTRTQSADPVSFRKYLEDADQRRLILITESRYQDVIHRIRASGAATDIQTASLPIVSFYDTLLLLPGPYTACAPELPKR